MLLDARHDLDALPVPQDRQMRVTAARLVELYDAWGKRDKAAAFRALLVS